MRIFVALAAAVVGMICAGASAPVTSPAIDDRMTSHLAPHPRLLLTAAGGADLIRACDHDSRLAGLRKLVLADATQIITLPPLQRVLTGRRLLSVSRDALHRIGTLALAYRLTHDRKYADAGRSNLLTLCAFTDFHPQHFLDTAEISAALAVGYDWLFDTLSVDDRLSIRKAMVDKALALDVSKEGWVHGNYNWTQVCHGGLAMAALAIAEDQPVLARRVVTSAVESVPGAMAGYAPDGAYPEGPSYWQYGTNYNVMLIASLQSALGGDLGLLKQPGFLASADYHLHTVSPTGLYFTYCDCGLRPDGLTPAAFYLSRQRNDPSLLWNELRLLDHLEAPGDHTPFGSNMNWLVMVLAGHSLPLATPASTRYVARGVTPVATFRSGWNADASFVGLKGGTPGSNHAHMDVGMFQIDSGGVRWAADLGMQGYTSLEEAGVKIWDNKQDSQRWSVFRIGAMSHSVLTVDGDRQTVNGRADWIRTGENFAVLDMTNIYLGQLALAHRGARLNADGSVRIQDEITGGKIPVKVRWALLTGAAVAIHGQTATLTKSGKSLTVSVLSPAGAVLKIVSTNPPPQPFDAPNPGTRLLTFEVPLTADQSQRIVVDFVPAGQHADSRQFAPLAKW